MQLQLFELTDAVQIGVGLDQGGWWCRVALGGVGADGGVRTWVSELYEELTGPELLDVVAEALSGGLGLRPDLAGLVQDDGDG